MPRHIGQLFNHDIGHYGFGTSQQAKHWKGRIKIRKNSSKYHGNGKKK